MRLRQAFVILALAIPPGILTGLFHPKAPAWSSEPPLELGQVRFETVLDWESVMWIDARSRPEYEEDHIPGALLLNEDEWEELFIAFLDVWDPDQKIVVYCGGAQCQLSEQVVERLRADLGSDDVFVLKGGWSEWSRRR